MRSKTNAIPYGNKAQRSSGTQKDSGLFHVELHLQAIAITL